MANLSIPDISIYLRPADSISFRNRAGFVVCDLLGDLVNLGMGDSAGLAIEGINPTISDSWLQQGASAGSWKIPNGVQFIRFLKDGVFREGASAQSTDPNSDLFGVILQGRIGYLDSKIAETSLEGAFTDLNWDEVQGTWQSVKPPRAQRCLRIRSSGSGPTHKARTRGNLPANRSLAGEVQFSAQGGAGAQAASRYQWGGDGDNAFSIVWRHGQKITVERKFNAQWRIIRALDMEPANMAGGNYTFIIRRIAGRLCLSINDRNFHFVMVDTPTTGRAKPIDVEWPAGKLQFNTFNCHATLGVGIVKYSDPEDTPYEGQFGRILPKIAAVFPDEETEPPEPKFVGWQRRGTNVSGVVNVADFAVDYDVTLTANAAGIDTPFVSKVMVRFAPEWREPTGAGIELVAALQTARVTLASLPSTPYAEASFTLDRTMLDSLAPGWDNEDLRYRPIEFMVRRTEDDGTYYDGAATKLFKGYTYKLDYQNDGPGARTVTLTCRDPIVRLQKPAAVIDHRFPPLDLLFAYAEASSPLSLAIYGYDGVAEILRRALGQSEADALVTYFSDHYPLLDFASDTAGFINVQSALTGQAPTTGGLMLPAPYGEDALTWINKLAEYDKAVFFYGWPTADHSSWPVPMYGRIPQILATMPTIVIPDNPYLTGDAAKLLLQATTETRPDRDINRVLAWANPKGANAPDFLPAIRMGEARLANDDINAAARTWERTLVIREDFGWIEGGVEALAQGVVGLLANSEMKWPSFTTRGNPDLQWGVKITFKMEGIYSDETIELDGKTYRCERVEHTFDMSFSSADVWTTTVNARPTARGVF